MRRKLWKRVTAAVCAVAMVLTGVNVNMPVLRTEAASSSWVWNPYYSESGYTKVPYRVLSAIADSQQTSGEGSSTLNGTAVHGKWDNLVDGATTSFWHTKYNDGDGTAPTVSDNLLTGNNTITITINEEAGRDVKGITVLPRQDQYGNGALIQFDVKVSTDGNTWTDAANDVLLSDHGSDSSYAANKAEKEVIFEQTYSNVKQVMIIAERTGATGTGDKTSSGTGSHITAAEISILTPESTIYTLFNPTTTVDGSDTYVLAENAATNSYNDADSEPGLAFDDSLDTMWHSNWGGTGTDSTLAQNDVVWGIPETIPESFSGEANNNRYWIGSSFGETISLGQIKYWGRQNAEQADWLIGYGLYVATTDQPEDADFVLAQSGILTAPTEDTKTQGRVIALETPVDATAFRLVFYTTSSSTSGTGGSANASKIEVYEVVEEVVEYPDLLKAGSISATDATITKKQPFAAGTAGINIFRIPCLITLEDGSILAAADARYTNYRDYGGIDTIASVSTDNGATWNYSFPIYFPDSAGSTGTGVSTTAIDPAIVQGPDGTIYCMADMNPTGITTLDTYPGAGTGYVTINGEVRLALTSVYDNASTLPTDDDTTTYEYYVGDFDANGFAKVLNRADGSESGYAVDEWYNIYSVVDGEYVANLTQTQVDSDTVIQQNAFYEGSVLHVYNTGYIWLVESNDGGISWENPRILNPQVKTRDGEQALLVSPGKGLVTSDGDIIIGCYNNLNSEDASFFYSTDNGETWARTTGDVPNSGKESENEIIELPNGTLRMFYRTDTMRICYVDITKADDGTYSFGTAQQIGDFQVSSNCNVSAVMLENKKIDGKPVVLVSLPSTPGAWNRNNGRIYVFSLNDDNTMNHENTYAVNEGEFAYSCMTVLENGNIGMLWEPGNNENSAIRYDEFSIEEVVDGKVFKDVELLVDETYTDTFITDSRVEITQDPDSSIATLEKKEAMEYAIPLYDHSGTVSGLDTFSTTANDALLLENAEFEFESTGTNLYTIYNEIADVYLTNSTSAGSYFSDTSADMYVEAVTDDTTGEVEFRISLSDQTRYIMFYFTGMNFNGNGGGYNSSMTDGSQELVLLEKKDTISTSDIVPGYVRATEIKADTKYLISYIYDGRAIVLYPTNGQDNQTKLVGESTMVTMYDHGSTSANADISLTDAELTFTKVDDNNNWTAYNAATQSYLVNNQVTDDSGNRTTYFFQTEEASVTVAPSEREEGKFTLQYGARYTIFYLNSNNFNAMSSYNDDTSQYIYDLVLLEKQDVVSSDDILPGYKQVSTITSGKTYLVAYVNGENTYVLYPSTSGNPYNAVTKQVAPSQVTVTNEVVITGVAEGETVATVGDITYNIKVSELKEKDVTVQVGETIRIFDQSGTFNESRLESLDTTIAEVSVETRTINDYAATLYGTSAYDGESINLSDCIYSFNRNADGTYSISSTTADGRRVYLNPHEGSKVGYPNTTTQESIVVEAVEGGGFKLKDASDDAYYLTFKNDWLVFNEEQTENVTTTFQLYELKETTLYGEVVYAYEPVTEVCDGGQYVIVAEFTDTDGNACKYALHPSTARSTDADRNTHIAKVTDETKEVTGNEILVKGISEGETSVIVGSTQYNISVEPAEQYITLKVGESVVIGGATMTQEPNSQYVTTEANSLTNYYAIQSLEELADGGEYILVTAQNTAKAVNKTQSTNSPSGLALTVMSEDNLNTLYWRITRNANGTYSIQDTSSSKYVNFATSGAVSLSDTPQELTIETLNSGFSIGNGSLYLNVYGGEGNNNAAGYNSADAGSTWYIYKRAIEITGIDAGETTAVIDGVTYYITVEGSQIVSETGTSAGQVVNRLTMSADNTFDFGVSNTDSTVTWKVVDQDGNVVDWATIDENGVLSAVNSADNRNLEGYVVATVDGEEIQIELKMTPSPTVDERRSYDVYIGELYHTDVYYGWIYEYETSDASGYASTDLTKVVEGEVIYVNIGSQYENALDFFAKPEEGYALTQMGATGSLGHYERLEGATPEETEFISESGVAGNNQYNSIDADATAALVQKAMDLGCHGAQGFTRYADGGGLNTTLNYRSEKLPTVDKTVMGVLGSSGLKADYKEYYEGVTAELNDYVYFKITVQTYDCEDPITYSNVYLEDLLDGAEFFVQNPDDYANPTNPDASYTIDITKDVNDDLYKGQTFEYYVVYKITKEDVIHPEQSIVNTVNLSYNYSSEYSSGTFGGEAEDDAKILITTLLRDDLVIDFGLPVVYTFASANQLVEQTDVATDYGKVTVTSVLDGGTSYTNTITYTPTKVLQGVDMITLTDSEGQEAVVGIYPATSVYYEESFADYDGDWDIKINEDTNEQDLRLLKMETDLIDNYGYDDVYENGAGASNGTEAVSTTAGNDANFTFTGTGVDIYANCQGGDDPTGTVSILIRDTDDNNAIKKLMIVNTEMAGETGAVSEKHDDITAYNIPIASVNDMGHSTYSVAIRHTSTTTTDADGNKVATAAPVKLDGFRVYNTVEDSSVFDVHGEANPNFVEMRNVVLNALAVDGDTSEDYMEDIKNGLTQVLDQNEEAAGVILTDTIASDDYVAANAQDLLDNGPKNELFLYPGQTLVFNLVAGVKNVQIGMKSVNVVTDVTVQKGTEYLLGTVAAAAAINSSTDMFYQIGDIAADTTITIANKGTGILSITDLKYFTEATTASVFTVINENDLVPALLNMGYESRGNAIVNPFADIAEGDYFYDAVLWAVEQGITSGTTATTFAPADECTRGQVVTFLYKAAGSPEVKTTENPFTDVADDAYYYDAVLWAVEKGITAGATATTFAPNDTITRGQVVTFLYRAAGKPAVETTTCTFTDVASDAYYYNAVLWAVEKGITAGTSTSTFAPADVCTRGQVVTFLYKNNQ